MFAKLNIVVCPLFPKTEYRGLSPIPASVPYSRVIPMGRRNWLFAWTELGAKHIGFVQSLLVTCRLHDVDPYTYFVDVLQRIGQHPASLVQQLTPRLWKSLYAGNPLRSDLHEAQERRSRQ